VGALVERPAFVPYLSGRRNLEWFWKAGGQSLGKANLERALEVAGLGDAIERKVGTYSKGMQQRLGLAQALLNQPELLVLDEPTVGLDPQEVREVRGIIREVTGNGATVIFSSHNLAEVEQVCSHAAVLDRGRLVASGTVSDLTRATSSVYVEVDDVDRAIEVLENLQGIGGVSREAPGLAVRLEGLEREALVSALVQQGIGVKTITSRHQLEDAFLRVLSEGSR
jgi:ABC-2 type transport system ATP-binding protein